MARRVLLFLPAIRPTDNQTAARLAQLAARFASKARSGSYDVKLSADTSHAVVLDPSGAEVLEIREVLYHDALRRDDASGAASARGALTALLFAIVATIRVSTARQSAGRRTWRTEPGGPPAVLDRVLDTVWFVLCALIYLVCATVVAFVLIDLVHSAWMPVDRWAARTGPSKVVAAAIGLGAVAIGLGLGAWRSRVHKVGPPKSTRARLQIALAAACVVALYLSFVIAAIGVLAAVNVPWFRDLKGDGPAQDVAWGIGAATIALICLARVRPVLVDIGQVLRSVLRYFEYDAVRLRVIAVFDEIYDAVLDEDEDTEVHLFAFSFGSIVALDALFPHDPAVERRTTANIRSLVTMGCPADFVRLIYPDHFDPCRARTPIPPWTNVYIPADVLASNFRPGTDDGSGAPGPDPDAGVAGVVPDPNLEVGRPRLKGKQVARMEGFALHGSYWNRDEPRYLERVIPIWIPPPPAPAAVAGCTTGRLARFAPGGRPCGCVDLLVVRRPPRSVLARQVRVRRRQAGGAVDEFADDVGVPACRDVSSIMWVRRAAA